MDITKCVAALFDFDGVVMDTESQYSLFWNKVGKQYHPEYEEFGRVIKGQTLKQIYDRHFQGMEQEQAEITDRLNRFETEFLGTSRRATGLVGEDCHRDQLEREEDG